MLNVKNVILIYKQDPHDLVSFTRAKKNTSGFVFALIIVGGANTDLESNVNLHTQCD